MKKLLMLSLLLAFSSVALSSEIEKTLNEVTQNAQNFEDLDEKEKEAKLEKMAQTLSEEIQYLKQKSKQVTVHIPDEREKEKSESKNTDSLSSSLAAPDRQLQDDDISDEIDLDKFEQELKGQTVKLKKKSRKQLLKKSRH